jgi:Uncharacterised protein conserved in bacteria (DUF2336)
MHDHLRDADFGEFASFTQRMRDSALLRATTELFVQELVHDRDEIRRYEELAIHLLPRVSDDDRAFAAERLAARLDAPPAIMRMLAKDRIEIAAIVLRRSPLLGPLDLLSVIAATGVAHHRLIAQRPGLPNEVVTALRIAGTPPAADHPTPTVEPIQVKGPVSTPEPTAVSPFVTLSASNGTPSRGRPLDPWAFLRLDRPARLRLMAELATREPIRRYDGPTSRLDRAFRTILGAARIVGYARSGKRSALIDTVAEGLGLEADLISAFIDDMSGEPFAVLLKTLGLDNAQAQQVFLLATPTIGRDVSGFFRLCDLYAAMEPTVAEILTAAWRDAGQKPARHQPVFAENNTIRRSSVADASRGKWQAPAEQKPSRSSGS